MIDGYMTCSIFREAINAEIFEEFIEYDVLPHCNLFLGPKSVIVMDNVGIHISEVLEKIKLKMLMLYLETPGTNR